VTPHLQRLFGDFGDEKPRLIEHNLHFLPGVIRPPEILSKVGDLQSPGRELGALTHFVATQCRRNMPVGSSKAGPYCVPDLDEVLQLTANLLFTPQHLAEFFAYDFDELRFIGTQGAPLQTKSEMAGVA
jgi:hypothetical protein